MTIWQVLVVLIKKKMTNDLDNSAIDFLKCQEYFSYIYIFIYIYIYIYIYQGSGKPEK